NIIHTITIWRECIWYKNIFITGIFYHNTIGSGTIMNINDLQPIYSLNCNYLMGGSVAIAPQIILKSSYVNCERNISTDECIGRKKMIRQWINIRDEKSIG